MRYYLSLLLLFSVLLASPLKAASLYETSTGKFSGWVSKVNMKAKLVRFKIKFNNFKYVNTKDIVELWNVEGANRRCKGLVVGKSVNHMLIKIKQLNTCLSFVYLGVGTYVQFYSQDLMNNLQMGSEINRILIKKHLALQSKLKNYQVRLNGHLDQMDAVNDRYGILRQKLEGEWRGEVAALEEDRLNVLSDYEQIRSRLQEVEFKMERYRIEDDNLSIDRWSLDSKQYTKR